MARNKPISAQQPAPLYANDASGFWGALLLDNATTGLGSILPLGTITQADIAVKSRFLIAQIDWTPAKARWKGCDLTVSLSDAQFFLALESGGDTQQGRLTVIVSKFQFSTGFPAFNDVFAIQAAGAWHQFTVAEMVGQNDDNEPALMLFLSIEQDDHGE